VIERRTQADILHLLLQVDKAVFQSEAVLQDSRVTFDFQSSLASCFVHGECLRARAGRNRNANDTGDRQRTNQ
jgi:hypothetical protein